MSFVFIHKAVSACMQNSYNYVFHIFFAYPYSWARIFVNYNKISAMIRLFLRLTKRFSIIITMLLF